jgi:peptidoglycan/LPS O-acetylase OafA/YrhL
MVAGSYLMNWYLIFDGKPGFLEHTWSLAIEEQFYLLWPVMLLLGTRYLSRRSLITLCVTVVLVCNLWRIYLWLNGATPTRIYMGLDTRFDQLLIGCLLALAPLRLDWRKTLANCVIVPLGVLTVMLPFLRWDSKQYELGMIITTLCAAWVLIAVLTEQRSIFAQILRLAPMNYLGRISYGCYLWHFPIWFILSWLLVDYRIARAPITLAMTIIVAAISYHWLELPVRRLNTAFSRHKPPSL